MRDKSFKEIVKGQTVSYHLSRNYWKGEVLSVDNSKVIVRVTERETGVGLVETFNEIESRRYLTIQREPWNFCETPEEKCTMNYCDENGCQNRKKSLVPIEEQLDNLIQDTKAVIGINWIDVKKKGFCQINEDGSWEGVIDQPFLVAVPTDSGWEIDQVVLSDQIGLETYSNGGNDSYYAWDMSDVTHWASINNPMSK